MPSPKDPLEPSTVEALAMFSGVRGLRAQRLADCVGLYSGANLIGIVALDGIYLRADAQTKDGYEKAGSQPYTQKLKSSERAVTLGFWRIPDAAKNNKAIALELADQAVECARRNTGPGRRRGPR